MCDMWLSAVDRSEIVGAVFLDFRKAFDLVDHTILQQKLRVYLNNSSAVRFFQSYLSDRSQYVCANGKFSATGTNTIRCSTRQYSRTSAILHIYK